MRASIWVDKSLTWPSAMGAGLDPNPPPYECHREGVVLLADQYPPRHEAKRGTQEKLIVNFGHALGSYKPMIEYGEEHGLPSSCPRVAAAVMAQQEQLLYQALGRRRCAVVSLRSLTYHGELVLLSWWSLEGKRIVAPRPAKMGWPQETCAVYDCRGSDSC